MGTVAAGDRATHPLDRPIWHALATRQAQFALGGRSARRFHPDFAMFAAAADETPVGLAALAALVAAGETVILMEAGEPPIPPGLTGTRRAGVQMVAAAVTAPEQCDDIVPLDDRDAPAMLALATLTAPGPFFARTHELGGFVGIKIDGQLVAMAGERMRLPGYAEVSGVCTHPDARGRGCGARLTRAVAARIMVRGEAPFLSTYADNAAAIALYTAIGFSHRARLSVTTLRRD